MCRLPAVRQRAAHEDGVSGQVCQGTRALLRLKCMMRVTHPHRHSGRIDRPLWCRRVKWVGRSSSVLPLSFCCKAKLPALATNDERVRLKGEQRAAVRAH